MNRLEGRHNTAGELVDWTDEDLFTAAATFEILGDEAETAKQLEIPESVLRSWMSTAKWAQAIERVRNATDERIDTAMTRVMAKALEKVMTRLEHGDEVVTKDGDIVRVEVSARDAAWVASTMHDKRKALRLRNVPDVGTDQDKLRAIAQFMTRMADEMRERDLRILAPATTVDPETDISDLL